MKSLKSISRKLNKKAISPLVSTIAMLAFAIILGLIVMGWGGEIEDKTYSGCSKARIDLVIINSEPILCYDDKNLNFMLENIGGADIDSFKLNIIGDKDIDTLEIKKSIAIGDVIKTAVPYDKENIGNIQLLKFFVMADKKYCGNSLLELDEVEPCD
tara:strand:- start:249 stop:719 length:471 start_codon:yes stop_codon:yes gene_type:complete